MIKSKDAVVLAIKIALIPKRIRGFAGVVLYFTTKLLQYSDFTHIANLMLERALTEYSDIPVEKLRLLADIINAAVKDVQAITSEPGKKAICSRIGAEMLRVLDDNREGKLYHYIRWFELLITKQNQDKS